MLTNVVPILRVFDVGLARDFYLGFLEFNLAFEHRFDDAAPYYLGIEKDGCVLHLSEHFGDATPGAHVRIEASGLDQLADQWRAKRYKNARPGAPQEMPWGTKELTLTDPFGNRLTFAESLAD